MQTGAGFRIMQDADLAGRWNEETKGTPLGDHDLQGAS